MLVPRARTGMPWSWANRFRVWTGAAELAGDVVQRPAPGEVFLAEPGQVEVEHAGLLARGPGGRLGRRDDGVADRAAGPWQRVPPQHLAQVVQGDAQAGCESDSAQHQEARHT